MGKSKKRQKYQPLDEEKISVLQTRNKSSEVKTPNNESSKKDVKKSISEEDMNKSREPLKEGKKLDAGCIENKHENSEFSSNDEDKSKEGTCLDYQNKNGSDNKKEKTGKMECDVSESINTNSNKACEESNKNKNKKNKNINSDQDIESVECLDDKAQSENNKKALEDRDKSSKSSKKKKTKASLLDQQSKNNSSDEKIDCGTKQMKKNNDDVCEESLSNHKNQNDSDGKVKCKISNSNTKINKNDERKRDKSSDSRKKKMSKCKEYGDQTSNDSPDKIKEDCNELETTSYNYKQEDKFKKGIRNKSSGWPHNTLDGKTKKVFKQIKNDDYEDKSQSAGENESFLTEIDEDLFALSNDFSLAHCVAEDLRMGAGIAVDFKKRFGGVGKLIDQNLKVGEIGIVNRHNQFVFYLITKKYSNGKPTMMTLELALESLLSKMKTLKLSKLGIPKIGCGLDGLDWSNVKSLIIKIFAGSGIDILVCIPSKPLDRKPSSSLKVYVTPKNLWEMEAQTDIIIFIDLDKVNKHDWTDSVINKVNDKYPFKEKLLKDVKSKKLNSGEILLYEVINERIFCVFFEQKTFYDCIENVFRANYFKSKNKNYLAIQSGLFNSDDTFKYIVWTVLIFRSISSFNELWLCGLVELKDQTLPFDQYCRNIRNSNSNSNDNSFSSSASSYHKNNDNPSLYTKGRSFSSSPMSMSKGCNYNDNNQSFCSKDRNLIRSSLSSDFNYSDGQRFQSQERSYSSSPMPKNYHCYDNNQRFYSKERDLNSSSVSKDSNYSDSQSFQSQDRSHSSSPMPKNYNNQNFHLKGSFNNRSKGGPLPQDVCDPNSILEK